MKMESTIKANELRLGNLIDRQDYICKVVGIDEEGIVTDPINYTTERFVIKKIEPIPLTEEWLLKFGAKKVNEDFQIGYYDFYINSHEIVEWELDDSGYNNIELDYVHQLQNLYFALTGKELELK